MDTAGAIMAAAVITTVGAAAITMAGTEATTTVGAIITAIGGDALIEEREAAAVCGLVHVYDFVRTAGHRGRMQTCCVVAQGCIGRDSPIECYGILLRF
ncbi:hypothetical protein [Bradyrhizobium pachyrhizi]|uniref:hypothetical protein n=1 Tax=Bradyrhizobium pachyrhizi TaxID=280333 RepID=UPI0018F8C081|nr:hypothetical protein [Bradyrhizobium pachyrhizi]